MEFAHSEVLFSGDDGLPIEFNIQNTVDKEKLKAIIEYGGGLCTLSDEAIILVSPKTKVAIHTTKTLTSSRYVFDCIKHNSLLNIDDYRVEIQEKPTSDFSDNSESLCAKPNDDGRKSSEDIIDDSVDIIGTIKTLKSQCHNSNHDFDFQDSESRNNVIPRKEDSPDRSPLNIPLQASGNYINFKDLVGEKNQAEACVNAVPDSLDFEDSAPQIMPAPKVPTVVDASANATDNVTENVVRNVESSAESVVSSSQPNVDGLDQFDNMIINKAQEKPAENVQNEDSLSQSYTVSSSADAQLSPKLPSHTSGEIFDGNSAVTDSDCQLAERQHYINDLEKEVEEILKKPSPKSIQDKTTLVKYICIVKKLPAARVLQTLQNF